MMMMMMIMKCAVLVCSKRSVISAVVVMMIMMMMIMKCSVLVCSKRSIISADVWTDNITDRILGLGKVYFCRYSKWAYFEHNYELHLLHRSLRRGFCFIYFFYVRCAGPSGRAV